MKKIYVFYFLFAFLLSINATVYAAPQTIKLEPTETKIPVIEAEYIEDTEGLWTIEDILTPEVSKHFIQNDKDQLNFGYANAVFWVRFQIENHSNQDQWILEISNPLLDSLEFYSIDQNRVLSVSKTGLIYPFEQRDIKNRHYLFPIEIQKDETHMYILRVESTSTKALPTVLWKPDDYVYKDRTEALILGLYFGLVLVMFTYNFFLGIALKRIAYFYYGLLIISFALFQFVWNGYAYEYLWPNSPWWAKYSLAAFIALCGVTTFRFTQKFLNTKEVAPKLHLLNNIGFIYSVIMLVLIFFVDYSLLVKFIIFVPIIIPGIVFTTGIICYRRGQVHARFFIIAWIAVMIGIFLSNMRNIGFLSDSLLTIYGMQIGGAIETTLLALALADQINTMRKEKEKAQNEALLIEKDWRRKLEEKVKERTTELESVLKNLQNTQTQLIEQEKMASLGNIVASVAHEINTPLGISVTAASHLRDNKDRLINLYHENKLKKNDLEKFFNLLEETTDIIENNLNRTSQLVKSFKQVAVDQTNEFKRNFYVKEYLNEILVSLKPQLRKTKIKVEISGDESISIYADPGSLSQIFTNLIINSITHGFPNYESGTISIHVQLNGSDITLSYSDDGIGMSEDVASNIFEPFYTTNRSKGGTGLGMHIVYNIVNQTLKGTITCSSHPGSGSTFVIRVPISN